MIYLLKKLNETMFIVYIGNLGSSPLYIGFVVNPPKNWVF